MGNDFYLDDKFSGMASLGAYPGIGDMKIDRFSTKSRRKSCPAERNIERERSVSEDLLGQMQAESERISTTTSSSTI